MTSIRRRLSISVALSMSVLLIAGGVVLLSVLRRSMTVQFDDGLRDRAAVLTRVVRYDRGRIEFDFTDVPAPRDAPDRSPECFVAWVSDTTSWRELGRSPSIGDADWPADALADDTVSIRDIQLAGGGRGRAAFIEFAPLPEADEADEPLKDGPGTADRSAGAANDGPAPRVRLIVALSRESLDDTLATITYAVVGVGAALLLSALVIARWAVARGLQPLDDLSHQVRDLGPQSLSARFDSRNLPAELRPIADQLSGLLERLDGAFQRERRFSAATSHELRTPIAELRLLLEVAGSQPRTAEQWKHTAGIALGVLAHAQALCESLLRLSHAGERGASVASDSVRRADVRESIDRETARAVALHGADATRVHVDNPGSLFAAIDPTILTSIVGNLLDNALRHGDSVSSVPITIRAHAEGDQIDIEIANAAPDLDAGDLARMFEPFWRKRVTNASANGFGLGLAVARALARADGGELTAEIVELGVVRMRLRVPAAAGSPEL